MNPVQYGHVSLGNARYSSRLSMITDLGEEARAQIVAHRQERERVAALNRLLLAWDIDAERERQAAEAAEGSAA
jgi:hypothetical protein